MPLVSVNTEEKPLCYPQKENSQEIILRPLACSVKKVVVSFKYRTLKKDHLSTDKSKT